MVPVKPPDAHAALGAINPAGVKAGTVKADNMFAKNAGFALSSFSNSNQQNPLSQLASSLGFPQDNLTFALLTFARVFSLPFESVMELRKEVLAFIPSSPKTDQEKAKAEAFSLASAAAAAKGLKLSQEALGEYVGAMGDFSGKEGGERRHQYEDKNQTEEPQAQSPNPAELRESFEKFSKNEDLLGLMNRIYDKNGQNWVVWPFKMSVGGTDLKVFVRILKEESFLGPGLLMADITGPKRHWRFLLEKSHEGKFRARIGLNPGLKALEREAAKVLDSFLGTDADLQVLNGEIMLADFMGCEALPSINKEV